MTSSESHKKTAKGFAGLSSLTSDVSGDAARADKAPATVPPAPPAAEPSKRQSASAEQPAKGFSGLSSMISDVSKDAASSAKTPDAAPPMSKAAGSPPPQPARAQSRPAPADSSPPAKSETYGLGWIVAVIMVVLVIGVASNGDHTQQPAPQSPAAPPSLAGVAFGAATNADSSILDEQMPPAGRDNVLSIPQIRWCMREKIRVGAIEGLVNSVHEGQVDAFNRRVGDYNSRCAAFRYRQGAVDLVERELESERQSVASTAKIEWAQLWSGNSDAPPRARAEEPESFGFLASNGTGQASAPSPMDLSQEEQASIDSACSDQKLVNGDTAYIRCASKKKDALLSGPRNIDLTALNASERESIESACSDQKLTQGPAEYNACLVRQLSALKVGPRNVDLSDLSQSERESMESSCSDQKLVEGPAAYNRCLSRKLAALRGGPRNVDLANLSDARRAAIETACSDQRLMEGPAAYNKCLTQKIGRP